MIGIDVVSIDRFEKFLDRYGSKALERFLTKEEISLRSSPASYAGFWAAKEAVSKALGTGIGKDCSFFDIRLGHDSKNAPYFTLSKQIIDRYKITDTTLSITHDSGFAIAVVYIDTLEKKDKQLSH